MTKPMRNLVLVNVAYSIWLVFDKLQTSKYAQGHG